MLCHPAIPDFLLRKDETSSVDVNTDRTSDEARLVRQAREGSASAFGGLVHLHHARVFAFLLGLTRHRQDAEDLTQDTFMRAWNKFGRFDPAYPLLPWLLTIARRQSIAALRKRQALPESPDLPAAEPEPPMSALWLWEVAKRELTADAYSALWLHYREEFPLKEVARVLGKREGAVKVLLHRARNSLAERMRGVSLQDAPETFAETRTTPS